MQNALKTQMKKHAKIVVLSLAGVAIALAGTVAFFSKLEPGTVGKTIPYLAAHKPKDEADMLTRFTNAGRGTLTTKTHTTIYTLDEKYETVCEALKKDLKSRSYSVTPNPAKGSSFTIIGFRVAGAARTANVSIRRSGAYQTTVVVLENRSVNPLDKVKLWYAGVTSKRKTGVLVLTNSKTNLLNR